MPLLLSERHTSALRVNNAPLPIGPVRSFPNTDHRLGYVSVLPVIATTVATEFRASLPMVFVGTSVMFVAMGLAVPWTGPCASYVWPAFRLATAGSAPCNSLNSAAVTCSGDALRSNGPPSRYQTRSRNVHHGLLNNHNRILNKHQCTFFLFSGERFAKTVNESALIAEVRWTAIGDPTPTDLCRRSRLSS